MQMNFPDAFLETNYITHFLLELRNVLSSPSDRNNWKKKLDSLIIQQSHSFNRLGKQQIRIKIEDDEAFRRVKM